MNTSPWHAGLCTNSPVISESRWRSSPQSSKLSVGMALGTGETAVPFAATTFSDSYVPLEQWNCQPREEAQQCRGPNFIEVKSLWEHYHSEDREMTTSDQLQISDLWPVSPNNCVILTQPSHAKPQHKWEQNKKPIYLVSFFLTYIRRTIWDKDIPV